MNDMNAMLKTMNLEQFTYTADSHMMSMLPALAKQHFKELPQPMIKSNEKLEAEIKVLSKRLQSQEEESKKSPEAEAKH